jgi:hypothetical protein
VRDVARPEDVVARAGLDRHLADLNGGVAFEHPEALVIAVMHVERRFGARMLGHLNDRHLSAGVGGRRLDHGQPAEPPARLSLAAADGYRFQCLFQSRVLLHPCLPR